MGARKLHARTQRCTDTTILLDHMRHHIRVFTIRGDSYRLKDKRRASAMHNVTATSQPFVNLRRGQFLVSFDIIAECRRPRTPHDQPHRFHAYKPAV